MSSIRISHEGFDIILPQPDLHFPIENQIKNDLEDVIRDMRIETGIIKETTNNDISKNIDDEWHSKQLEQLKRELESFSPLIEDYDSTRPTFKEKASLRDKLNDWWRKRR